VQGVRDGRSYCCDGRTHLFDFKVDSLGVGEQGEAGRPSVLVAKQGQSLKVTCKAAALLDDTPNEQLVRNLAHERCWHIERARVKGTRQVPVELVVNGQSVEKKLIEADGRVEDLVFEFRPERSSWIALRVFPSAHTNPVFLEVGGKPIRASKRSAKWCLEGVERCWHSKAPQIRESERQAARDAYDHAKLAYEKIMTDAFDDTAN
jgi:hypothetical protein